MAAVVTAVETAVQEVAVMAVAVAAVAPVPARVVMVAGVTGLVGREVLAALSVAENIRAIHVVGRRAPGSSDARIRFHPVDFGQPAQLQQLPQVDDVYIALTDKKSAGRRLAAYFVLLRRRRSGSMENVKSIENAVESLPPQELAEFRRWFADFDGAAWDRQIEHDVASGKLDQLAAEALADYRAGSLRQL